jgi:hypothetical protein
MTGGLGRCLAVYLAAKQVQRAFDRHDDLSVKDGDAVAVSR